MLDMVILWEKLPVDGVCFLQLSNDSDRLVEVASVLMSLTGCLRSLNFSEVEQKAKHGLLDRFFSQLMRF